MDVFFGLNHLWRFINKKRKLDSRKLNYRLRNVDLFWKNHSKWFYLFQLYVSICHVKLFTVNSVYWNKFFTHIVFFFNKLSIQIWLSRSRNTTKLIIPYFVEQKLQFKMRIPQSKCVHSAEFSTNVISLFKIEIFAQ